MLRQACFNRQMDKSIFTPEQEILQQVLRQLRLGMGLRQEDIAERLNEPQSFVSKYESGERRLDLIELRQICLAIGVTLQELIRRFEEQAQSCNPTQRSSAFQKSFGQTSEQ
jgi:transcriptional regulator with XRE-family HTH domain